jgi:superfamily II DNA or RNA helicase
MFEEIKLEPLKICGIMGTALIPLATLNITDPSTRAAVIEEILTELATKPYAIMANTMIFTEGFDGFRIL